MTAALNVYPASLLLEGRPVLVVGGGRIAARKVEALLAAGASVTVVAPAVDPRIVEAGVRVERRRYRPGEVARYRLAVAATGDPQVDHLVFEDGERAGVFVNAADDRDSCSFVMPAVVRRGSVTVAVSTGGASPALAAWLRARVEEVVTPAYAALSQTLSGVRAEVQAHGVRTEDLDWDSLIRGLLASGPPEAVVEEWLESALGARREVRSGA